MIWVTPEISTSKTPWKSKDYFLNGFSVKTIVLVGIYNQQFKGLFFLWSLTSRETYEIINHWKGKVSGEFVGCTPNYQRTPMVRNPGL